MFGLHQCTHPRLWTEEDETLLQEVGRRIADAMSSLLTLRDLRESQERYRALVDNAHLGIGLMNTDFDVLMSNAAQGRMLQKDYRDFIGGKCYIEFEKRNDVCPHCPGRRAMESGHTHEVEAEGVRANGTKISVRVQASPVYGADGRIDGFVEIVEDITERKRAENALRESEEKHRSMIELSPDAIVVLNKLGVIVSCNSAAQKISGYSKNELVGRHFKKLGAVSLEDMPKYLRMFTKILKGSVREPFEIDFIRKDGSQGMVEVRVSLLEDGNVQAIVTDIKERKRAEQALRESEERLKILFESAPDAIYLIDSEGKIVDGNKTALELIGFAKDEVIGQSLAEVGLLSGEQLSRAESNLKKVASGKLSGPNEYVLKRKDGTHVSIEVRTFPVKIEGKMLTLGIARDITMHKQTEKELLEHQAKLKSLASQLSLTEEHERHRLATDLHDQIGQSLVISKIKLDQLRKTSTSDEFNKPLEDICNCLGQIIDDTRTLTFDLSYPILYELGFEAAVAEWLTDQIQEKHGIETEFVDDGHHKPLDDDIRVLLFRNVRELLINVVKHAQANKVKVSIRKVKDNVCVSVDDDGVGFDPVEVASMAAKRAEFGLFSIRERLEQLGGLIEIDSEPGRGSKITMTAPLKNEDQADRL
jgi:PAS domain S-box-containing protein